MTATDAPLVSRTHTYPVIEIFGPTIQGEGALAGAPTMFVRFGGCDYRCSWCDSMYAVDPAQVRENAVKMEPQEIIGELLRQLGAARGKGMWVTLSGGNPALMDFDRAPGKYNFLAALRRFGFQVTIETQGSVWRDWLAELDHLTVSPKPPSSGMATEKNREQTERFLDRASAIDTARARSMKIVVFDQADLEYAREMHLAWPAWPFYLSSGTDQEATTANHGADLLASVATGYKWLAEAVAGDPDFRDARVLCQLHVIAFGARRGV